MDKFQKVYLEHQARKKNALLRKKLVPKNKYSMNDRRILREIITNRKSVRIFKRKIDDKEIAQIIKVAKLAPSSCNRHGVEIRIAPKKLTKLLVGGKGWCNKGTVLAFYAHMKCYKSPYEKEFMPYLDTGFMAQNIYLYCETKKLGCCFINPNTHNKYKLKNKLLTGAITIGW